MQPSDIRVLVVDDDAANRLLVTRVLETGGVSRVHCEPDFASIDEIVADFDPDAVLLDLHVGGRDGFGALRLLAERDARFAQRAIVLVTGDSAADVRAEALRLGAADVLVKPYDLATFWRTLEAALDSRPST